MQIPDLINGVFELGGGLMSWVNFKRLLRDKKVKGVDWRITGFWSLWGTWNLAFYPLLGQWASAIGGVFLVAGNTAWVVLAIKYRKSI